MIKAIHVIGGIRQTLANNQNPAVDRRRDEKFAVARFADAFRDGTGRRIMQAESVLDFGDVTGLDSEPAAGAIEKKRSRPIERIARQPEAFDAFVFFFAANPIPGETCAEDAKDN